MNIPALNLEGLNERQKQAVTTDLVPTLVLSGAGSGKTRVLAFRVAYLVRTGAFLPEHILALTFTNKAAREMRERVLGLLGEGLPGLGPVLSTFHSLGVQILRQHGYVLGVPMQFSILDSEDQLKVLKEVFADRSMDEGLKPQAVLHFIHAVKNTGRPAPEVAESYRGYVRQQFLAAYEGYAVSLHRQGSVDLDDLIGLPLRLLAEFPEVRAYYQNKFRYVLVDEYQDTNPVQYAFLRQLAPPAPLFVVGDDAQSIYGFRGSDITNILNFERDFPAARVVVLDQNYRSTQHILAVADAVLLHSTEQKPKVLWTENEAGQRVVVKELGNEMDEAAFVTSTLIDLATTGESEEFVDAEADTGVNEGETQPFSVLSYMLASRRGKGSSARGSLKSLPASHGPLSEFAVLYRTHAQSRAFEAAFMDAGIPYKIVGGLRFYERKEIKDVLSFLRIVHNVADTIALTRALGVPPRGIGEKTTALIKEVVLSFVSPGSLQEDMQLLRTVAANVQSVGRGKTKAAIADFFGMLTAWHEVPGDAELAGLLERIIADARLYALYKDGTEVGDARIENIQELVAVARKYAGMPWQEALPVMLEEVALMSDMDAAGDAQDAVTLMTLHAAKGLEFDTVFFAGLEEGILPHSRSMMDDKAFAEEVRLAYVGVTRARKRLYITYVRTRGLFGESRLAVPSRLLRNLPENAVRWSGPRPRNIHTGGLSDGRVSYEPFEE